MKDDVRSLSHSKWRCKYHIVFAPKYRRQIIYKQLKADIGKILRELSERKGVEIIEAECCPDHIHMLVAIPPHLSVAGFMGYLKSKSSLMIFDWHANLKYKYGNRHLSTHHSVRSLSSQFSSVTASLSSAVHAQNLPC